MSVVSFHDLKKVISGFGIAVDGTASALPVLANLPSNDSVFLLVKEMLQPVLSGIIQSVVELIDTVIALLGKIEAQLSELQTLHDCGQLFTQFHEQLLVCIAETGDAVKKLGDALSIPASVPGLGNLSSGVQSFFPVVADFFSATDMTSLRARVPVLKNELSVIREKISTSAL